MSESVAQRCNNVGSAKQARELQAIVESLRQDLTNLTTAYGALLTKLDADSGVGDTDYAANTSTKAPTLGTVA